MEIRNTEELEKWLTDKPAWWAAAIAQRAALRVLPIALDPANWRNVGHISSVMLVLFRAHAISTGAAKCPTPEIGAAKAATLAAVIATSRAVVQLGDVATRAADAAAYSTDSAVRAANSAVGAVPRANSETATRAADASANASSSVAEFYVHGDHVDAIESEIRTAIVTAWSSISADANALEDVALGQSDPREQAAWLLSTPLWPFREPNWYAAVWANVSRVLGDNGFPLWRGWYERRVAGRAEGFHLPPQRDAEMARRLIAQSDNWWQREPAAIVNDDIQGWLDELTQDVEEGVLVADSEQNPHAPNFEDADDDGIGLANEANAGRVRSDEGAHRRHGLVRRVLVRGLDASALELTQSVEIGATISDALDALGSSPEKMHPEAYVVFSKALRREMKELLSGQSLRPPLSENQSAILETWLDADAVLISQDEVLAMAERAIYDRRFGPVQVEREALRELIAAANASGVPDERAAKVLDAAGVIVPEGTTSEPDAQVAVETSNNFFRSFARKVEWLRSKGTAAGPKVWKLGQYLAERNEVLVQKFPVMKPIWDFIKEWIGKSGG